MALSAIGAIVGGGAALLGASKNSKAIKKSTAAQTAANEQSVGLQREIYGENKAALSPYVQAGIPATQSINAMLLGTPQQQQSLPQQQPNALAQFSPQYGFEGMDGPLGGYGGNAGFNAPQQPPAAPQGITQPSAEDAFAQFRNSTGYKFRMNEGQDALNSGYAGSGVLQSGAALKGLEDYRQNYASGEFGNYLNALQTQQQIGMGAASAQAGVGQSFANRVTDLNTAQSNNLAESALARARNSNQLLGGIANGVNLASGAFGSFGNRPPPPVTTGGFGGGSPWSMAR